MRHLITAIFCFISLFGFAQTDHIVEPSVGGYGEEVTLSNKEENQSRIYQGLELNFRHSLKGLDYVGTDFGVIVDNDLQLPVLYLGISIRHSMFNDFLEGRLLLPRMHMPFDGVKPIGYNTPFGLELRVFKGRVRTKVTSLFYGDGVTNRLTIFYLLTKE